MKLIYEKKNKIFIYRIIYITIILTFILIYIIYCIYKLQIINFKKYYILSKKNYIKIISIIPHRGIILDRNNIPIAINKNYYYINILPHKIKNFINIINIFKKIKISNKIIKYFKKKYKNNKKYNIKISHIINKNNLIKFYIYKPLLKGVKIKKYTKRNYPFKNILSHVIGYININNKNKQNITGKTGIEKYYEKKLYGKKGYKKIIKNNKGKTILKYIIKLPKAGKNIKLSIDIKLQKFIYNLIKNNNASIIVTNCKNGNILSLISVPSFNPNIFTKKISKKKYKKILNNKDSPLFNKVIQGIYPPASTIKPYIAIASLEEKIINKNFKMFDPGWWKLPKSNKIFHDWKKTGHNKLNIIKSIEESSDTFYYQLSYHLGIKKIINWIKKFKFGNKTNIDLPNEKKLFLPNKKWKEKKYDSKWYLGDTISIGIGQGYLITTPIQIHQALLILINNGYIIKPHLLLNKYKKKNKKYIIKNIKNKNWKIIKKGMYGVAHKKNGTAYWNFINTKYKIAVKSGTAQVYSIKNHYEKQKNIKKSFKDHILMNAFLPYKNPKFAITIILEHGGNGDKIGEIVRKITDFIILNKIKT